MYSIRDNFCILFNKLPNQIKIIIQRLASHLIFNKRGSAASPYSNLTNLPRVSASHLLFNKRGRQVEQFARYYSTTNLSCPSAVGSSAALIDALSPFFITGLTDAEGSLSCIIKKNAAYKSG